MLLQIEPQNVEVLSAKEARYTERFLGLFFSESEGALRDSSSHPYQNPRRKAGRNCVRAADGIFVPAPAHSSFAVVWVSGLQALHPSGEDSDGNRYDYCGIYHYRLLVGYGVGAGAARMFHAPKVQGMERSALSAS